MISGIVNFEEIVEGIKDATDIQNMNPLYDKIRRFIFSIEREIGAGGLIVRKKKEFTKGDGFYDGNYIILPSDFIGENSYAPLTSGVLNGNIFQLYEEGPTEIDLRYMSFLLDNNGNPFTTRNHLVAVIAYATYRLYSSKMFHKTGNLNLYLIYKQEYDDAVLEARGEDAFPNEEQWDNIGRTLNGGALEAMTDCGMRTIIHGTNDPIIINTESIPALITCIGRISGSINSKTTVTGEMTYDEKIEMDALISSMTTVTGWLQNATQPEMSIEGSIDGIATVEGLLTAYAPTILCNETFQYNGGPGTFSFKLELGAGTGSCGILATSYSYPDRFRIEFNGVEVANSKFIGVLSIGSGGGYIDFTQELLDLGYDPSELDLTTGQAVDVPVLFNKLTASPSFAWVHVDAPLTGTLWVIKGQCP